MQLVGLLFLVVVLLSAWSGRRSGWWSGWWSGRRSGWWSGWWSGRRSGWWSGWRSGFIYSAIGLVTWVGSVAAAFCLFSGFGASADAYGARAGRLDLAGGVSGGAFVGEVAAMAGRGRHRPSSYGAPEEWVEERLSPVFERPVERTIARLSIVGGCESAG